MRNWLSRKTQEKQYFDHSMLSLEITTRSLSYSVKHVYDLNDIKVAKEVVLKLDTALPTYYRICNQSFR